MLPCGHCFCSACVAFLEKRECPECRTKMGKKELPRNFALLDLIASISTVSATSSNGEMVVGDKRKRDRIEADELLAMLNLKDPTEDDIINATNRFIKKATAHSGLQKQPYTS
jgi:hypothetical protein